MNAHITAVKSAGAMLYSSEHCHYRRHASLPFRIVYDYYTSKVLHCQARTFMPGAARHIPGHALAAGYERIGVMLKPLLIFAPFMPGISLHVLYTRSGSLRLSQPCTRLIGSIVLPFRRVLVLPAADIVSTADDNICGYRRKNKKIPSGRANFACQLRSSESVQAPLYANLFSCHACFVNNLTPRI